MSQTLIAGLIALLIAIAATFASEAPPCWEDEVVVMVIADPYGDLEGTVGCVPADNLPVTGFRP